MLVLCMARPFVARPLYIPLPTPCRALQKNLGSLSHAHSSGELPEETAPAAADNLGTRMMSGCALQTWVMNNLLLKYEILKVGVCLSVKTGQKVVRLYLGFAAETRDEMWQAAPWCLHTAAPTVTWHMWFLAAGRR